MKIGRLVSNLFKTRPPRSWHVVKESHGGHHVAACGRDLHNDETETLEIQGREPIAGRRCEVCRAVLRRFLEVYDT